MFQKIVDVLKEVFWIKKSKKKRATVTKKKTTRPSKAKPVAKSSSKKPLKVAKPVVKKKVVKPVKEPKVKAIKAPVVKAPKVKTIAIDPNLTQIGEITHYFERIKVVVVKITNGSILIGDRIHIIGPKTKFIQKVWSLQIDRQDVKVAKEGQEVGLKLDKAVAIGDLVYK